MKTIRIISSPGTKYELVEEKTVYAPKDQIYCITDDLEFARTEEQSQKRIKELEAEVEKLQEQLEYWSYIPNY